MLEIPPGPPAFHLNDPQLSILRSYAIYLHRRLLLVRHIGTISIASFTESLNYPHHLKLLAPPLRFRIEQFFVNDRIQQTGNQVDSCMWNQNSISKFNKKRKRALIFFTEDE